MNSLYLHNQLLSRKILKFALVFVQELLQADQITMNVVLYINDLCKIGFHIFCR